MALEIKKAVRRALPLQIAFVGPTNSGKTLSALLFAAGLCPGGKVVVIDTEHGRASLYADNKRLLAVMPQGFDVIELDAPYTPKRYIQAFDLAESKGYNVCIPDSMSDEWDGPGGCCDIAEAANGKWNGAKLENKRFMNRIALSDMHMLCCFKAQEKTKIIAKDKSASGKQEFVEMGMQPVTEKGNFYPMTLSFMVDPITHLARATKMHDDLADQFREPHLISAKDGEIVRLWNQGGKAIATNEQLIKRSQDAASQGMATYHDFFAALNAADKKALLPFHADNKAEAERIDYEAAVMANAEAETDAA